MGNAGDLVKHGLLAEFVQWWCRQEGRPIRFLDPFAGRPWTASPPKKEVTRRIEALPSCAIRDAQPEPATRYYGSTYAVVNAAQAARCSAEVYFSDSDPDALRAFQGHALRRLECPGFSPSDGFSILDAEFGGDLLLLDPFADFLPRRADETIPKIATASKRIACILFVLNLDPENRCGKRYRTLRSQYLAAAWSLRCPKLPDRGVAGESRYEVEVLLVWRGLAEHSARNDLRDRLEIYTKSLSGVLNQKILFTDGEGDARI
jgi:hypothetical protein